MSFFERLKYSFYLSVVGGAVMILLLAVANVVGFLPATSRYLVAPHVPLGILLVLSYLVAPKVAHRFPVSWERGGAEKNYSAKNAFAVRGMVLAGVGMLVVLCAKLIIYLLG